MLVLFVLYSASNAMQWIQYSIIANIVMHYYSVSSFLINMTSMIYMITYIPLIFPASYLLDKFVSITLFYLIILLDRIKQNISETYILCLEIIIYFLYKPFFFSRS